MRHGERLVDAINLIAALATIGGIAFAIYSYLQVEHDSRVSASLTYIGRFNSEPIINNFKAEYDAYATPDGQKIAYGEIDPKDLTRTEIQFIESKQLRWSAILLGDFFDQVYVCIKRHICDSETALLMLGRDIESVYVYEGRYLEDFRERTHALTGCGLVALYNVASTQLAYARASKTFREANPPPVSQLDENACNTI